MRTRYDEVEAYLVREMEARGQDRGIHDGHEKGTAIASGAEHEISGSVPNLRDSRDVRGPELRHGRLARRAHARARHHPGHRRPEYFHIEPQAPGFDVADIPFEFLVPSQCVAPLYLCQPRDARSH